MHDMLDSAPQPLYFLSDLRKGRIVGMRAIAELGKCTQHPKWAGSTAFTQNPISRLFVDSFRSMTCQ
jgi:hypothetical protein